MSLGWCYKHAKCSSSHGFLGLVLRTAFRDDTTLCLFREKLAQAGLDELSCSTRSTDASQRQGLPCTRRADGGCEHRAVGKQRNTREVTKRSSAARGRRRGTTSRPRLCAAMIGLMLKAPSAQAASAAKA